MSTLKASDLISRFSEAITITRKAAGTYVSGVYIPGVTSSINAIASIQPLNGKELQALPELQHAKEVYKIYTSTELLTVNDALGTRADIVSFGGKTFEVQKVEPWQYDFTFFKAIITRVVQ